MWPMKLINIEIFRYQYIGRQALHLQRHHVHRMSLLLHIYLFVWIAGIISLTLTVFLLTKKSALLISFVLLAIPLYFLYNLQKEIVKTFALYAAVFIVVISFVFPILPSTIYAASIPSSSVPNISLQQITNNTIPEQSVTKPTPYPTSVLQPGTMLFQENGLDNWQNWNLNSNWIGQNGKLLSNGKGISSLTAPFNPGKYIIADYVVEAKITWVWYYDTGRAGFGLTARSTPDGGGYTFSMCAKEDYTFDTNVGSCADNNSNSAFEALLSVGQNFSNGGTALSSVGFKPSQNIQYTYRIEVQGDNISAFIDGNRIIGPITDDTYWSGGQVGIWSENSKISVSSFQVFAI